MRQFGTGASLIAQERIRQLQKGYLAEHDDEHGDGSLLHAGLLILLEISGHELKGVDPPDINGPWPDCLLIHVREKYADDEIRQLTIAGAMIAAEIDRLQRRQQKAQ